MKFKNCIIGSLHLDTGDAAPTFNFDLTDFYTEVPFSNSWEEVYAYYKSRQPALNPEPLAFEKAFVKAHAAALQDYVLTAVHHLHLKSYPEEGIETIRMLCSEQFELPPPAPGDIDQRPAHTKRAVGLLLKQVELPSLNDIDQRPAHMKGDASSLANAYASKSASLEDQAVPKRAETPLHALIEIANEMARNVMRRLHDVEKPVATLLVRAYLGSAMPLTIAGALIIACKETGQVPSAEEFQAQAKRCPGFWQPELLEQSLDNINKSGMDPALKTLAAAAEYHRNKQYFDDLDADVLLQEAVKQSAVAESVEL